MVIISISAPSKTGKTTFLEELIPRLKEKNIVVGALKHCHHPLSSAQNTDSKRLEKAGATPSIATQESTIEPLMPYFHGCDIVLVEGFRSAALPSILLCRGTIDHTWEPPHNIIQTLDITDCEKAVHSALEGIQSLLFAQ